MKRVLRWIGISLGALAAVALVALGVLYGLSARKLNATHRVAAEQELVIPTDSASIARGAHLMNSRPCGVCHGDDLGGKLFADAGPFALIIAPNLTRGRGGRTPPLTDVEWERAIRHGVRREGTSLLIMPSEIFHHIADDDMATVIAYLKQIPPVDREVQRTTLRIVGRILLGLGQFQTATEMVQRAPHVASVDRMPGVEYGRYIVSTAGCQGCHGNSLSGGPAFEPGGLPPANLTPTGIGHYKEEDFTRALRTGVRPNGVAISEQMPWKYYRNMTDDEIHSVWLFLQTLPPKQFAEQ